MIALLLGGVTAVNAESKSEYQVMHLVAKEQLASVVYQKKSHALTQGDFLLGSNLRIVGIDSERIMLDEEIHGKTTAQAILYKNGFLQRISSETPKVSQQWLITRLLFDMQSMRNPTLGVEAVLDNVVEG